MDYRHRFALQNLKKIKEHLDEDVLTEWEIDFITEILENEKLTETKCVLNPKEYSKLHEITREVEKRVYERMCA